MHDIVRKETSVLMILVTIFGVILMLFFAKMLYDMTGYVGQMAKSVNSMSSEPILVNKKIDKMNEGMEAMNVYMGTMNIHVKNIQSDMAKDISSMSSSVRTMSSDMGEMKTDMNKGVNRLTPIGMVEALIA